VSLAGVRCPGGENSRTSVQNVVADSTADWHATCRSITRLFSGLVVAGVASGETKPTPIPESRQPYGHSELRVAVSMRTLAGVPWRDGLYWRAG